MPTNVNDDHQDPVIPPVSNVGPVEQPIVQSPNRHSRFAHRRHMSLSKVRVLIGAALWELN